MEECGDYLDERLQKPLRKEKQQLSAGKGKSIFILCHAALKALFCCLQQENKGLREILQITRESFLNLKEDASESTSLSALVTNSDLSLRKN